MTIVGWLIYLLIAAICGGVGRAIGGGTSGGLIVSIAVGFIGAFLGSWLATRLGFPEPLAITIGTKTFPVLWSIIGASLFVALIQIVTGGRRAVA